MRAKIPHGHFDYDNAPCGVVQTYVVVNLGLLKRVNSGSMSSQMTMLEEVVAIAIGVSYFGLILVALLVGNRVRVRLRHRERVACPMLPDLRDAPDYQPTFGLNT